MVDIRHGSLLSFHPTDPVTFNPIATIATTTTTTITATIMGPLRRSNEEDCEVDVLGDVFTTCNNLQSPSLFTGGLCRSRSLFSLAPVPCTKSSTTNPTIPNLSSLSTSSSYSYSDERTIRSLPTTILLDQSIRSKQFGADLREHTHSSPDVPIMNRGLRETMEPYLTKARIQRDESRRRIQQQQQQQHHFAAATVVHSSIASSVGVPYTNLRSERPFLFDSYTHPLQDALATTLGISDLSKLHEQEGGHVSCDLTQILSPLLNRQARRKFQETYDSFVTSFCIPLLHSLAMSKGIFHHHHHPSSNGNNGNNSFDSSSSSSSSPNHSNHNNNNCISYRYQSFPSIRIHRPGDTRSAQVPTCDTIQGHGIGYLQFHVPLTASFGTNALYTESHPGKEDWHPLVVAKSVGLGFLLDGARCLQYTMENTTAATSVSLNFRIAIYRDGGAGSGGAGGDRYYHGNGSAGRGGGETHSHDVGGSGLCSPEILEDCFSRAGPGYYNDAVIDLSLGSPSWQIVAKKPATGTGTGSSTGSAHPHLLDPDYRVGFPFV